MGPIICVVLKATDVVEDGVVDGVVAWLLLEDCSDVLDDIPAAAVVTELVGEASVLSLFLEAKLPPTPPPTAAPIITTIATIATIQKVLGAKPQVRRF